MKTALIIALLTWGGIVPQAQACDADQIDEALESRFESSSEDYLAIARGGLFYSGDRLIVWGLQDVIYTVRRNEVFLYQIEGEREGAVFVAMA